MRAHNLSDLDITGREKILHAEPHFDFYRIKRARSASITFGHEADDGKYPSLVLVTDYRGDSGAYELTIRFDGIRELVLPEMRPALLFTELEVEDVRGRMLEGVRFEVASHYDRSFQCLCRDIAVVNFEIAP